MTQPDFVTVGARAASWFVRKIPTASRHRDDFAQEAALVAWQKFPTYDPEKGSFECYVWPYMRKAMQRQLSGLNGPVSRPATVYAPSDSETVEIQPDRRRSDRGEFRRDAEVLISPLNPEEDMAKRQAAKFVRDAVNTASKAFKKSKRAKEIIFASIAGSNAAEIGRQYGLTRERVRQICSTVRI